jgi:hypothetical protein
MKNPKIEYHSNGCKAYEQYHDLQGEYHRKAGLPDYHSWYPTGMTSHITYFVHGKYHNISNPANIHYYINSKIISKIYSILNITYSKIHWQNKIKKI